MRALCTLMVLDGGNEGSLQLLFDFLSVPSPVLPMASIPWLSSDDWRSLVLELLDLCDRQDKLQHNTGPRMMTTTADVMYSQIRQILDIYIASCGPGKLLDETLWLVRQVRQDALHTSLSPPKCENYSIIEWKDSHILHAPLPV